MGFGAVVVELDGLFGEGDAGVGVGEGPLDGGGVDDGVEVGGVFLELGLDDGLGAEVVAVGEERIGGGLLGEDGGAGEE